MSQDFGSLQQELVATTNKFYEDSVNISQSIKELLQDKLANRTQEITNKKDKLEIALKEFNEIVANPEIVFATTGTTSSGKSTLVNLLCGSFIMPEAVGEMSAGVVEIEHGEDKVVEVLPTKDASWFIGRRAGLSDEDMQALLTEVMHGYNDRREENPGPECPRIKVTYPTKLGLEISQFGLPEDTFFSLKILDLPGLKHVSDKQNSKVIESYCKQALSLVTYNAAETDPNKQETLLKQVVGQVKEIGGTPARMMFILNRFDVYENDSDPDTSKKRAYDMIQTKIREVLARELPEHKEDAEKIKPQRLATKPALLVERKEFKEIDRYFSYLVDEDVLDELPRKVEKWSEEDCIAFSKSVLKGCYVDEFRESLRTHVSEHLPQILFPHPIQELKHHGLYPTLNAMAQTVKSVLSSSEKEYQNSIDRLAMIESRMKEVYQDTSEFYERVISGDLVDVPNKLRQRYKTQDVQLISALANYQKIIHNCTENLFEAIGDFITDDVALPQDITESTPHREVRRLNKSMSRLKKAGYCGSLAEEGNDNYEERAGTGNLAAINQALNDLAETIADVIPSYLNVILNRESKRIKNAIQAMMKLVINDLYQQAVEVAGNQLSLTPPILGEIEKSFESIEAYFEMEAGFSTHRKNRREYVGKSWEKVGEKRTLKSLFLFKRDVYDYVNKYEKRDYDTAKIPSVYDIIDGFAEQLVPQVHTYNEEVRNQVKTKLNESLTVVRESQEENLQEFKVRLEEAQKELSQKFLENQTPWKELDELCTTLLSDIDEFSV